MRFEFYTSLWDIVTFLLLQYGSCFPSGCWEIYDRIFRRKFGLFGLHVLESKLSHDFEGFAMLWMSGISPGFVSMSDAHGILWNAMYGRFLDIVCQRAYHRNSDCIMWFSKYHVWWSVWLFVLPFTHERRPVLLSRLRSKTVPEDVLSRSHTWSFHKRKRQNLFG